MHGQGQEPLTATMLAAAQPQEQKQMLGKYSILIDRNDIISEKAVIVLDQFSRFNDFFAAEGILKSLQLYIYKLLATYCCDSETFSIV